MLATSRYALYFAPSADSSLWKTGSAWLGRDASRDQRIKPPPLLDILPDTLLAFTQEPRRYGFHATLKAPFYLAPDSNLDALLQDVEQFAYSRASFVLPRLKVSALQDFLALIPAESINRISAMERHCVTHFDHHRRPATDVELAKRRAKRLSPREDELLLRWGYSHLLDRYRFHLTLTDSLRGTHYRFADRIFDAAERTFAGAAIERQPFDAISVFEEPQPGADFRLILRAPFGRQGRLVYLVGPSGAGKDSVMNWAREHLRLQRDLAFAQLVITRPHADHSEQHEAMSEAAFTLLQQSGGFAMCWEASGLRYGIRREIDDAMQRGMTVVVKGSCAHLPHALQAYPHLEAVHITTPDAMIEQRLRGRGATAQIAARRSRSDAKVAGNVAVTEIVNDGALAVAGRQLLNLLVTVT